MAQHDYVIDNQLFPQTRADINAALQAILTQNSGPSAPSVFNAGTFWYDTVNQVLKRRNDSNTAWVGVASVDLTPEQIASIIDQLGDLATQDSVGVGDIDPAVVGTAELSDGAATLAKLATNSVDNTKVVTNTLALDKLVQASANVLLGRRTTSGNVVEVPYTEAGYAVMNALTTSVARGSLAIPWANTREQIRVPTLVIDAVEGTFIKRNRASTVRQGDVTSSSFSTFTRATTSLYHDASGVIRSASSGVPTFNFPRLTAQGGLGLFRAATNLLLWSQDLANAWWTKGAGLTVPTVTKAGAPDLTATSNTLQCSAGTDAKTVTTTSMTSLTSTDHYGLSFFLRKVNYDFLRCRIINSSATVISTFDINLASGVPVISGTNAADVLVFPFTGSHNHHRLEVYTSVTIGATGATVEFGFIDASGNTTWTAAGTEQVDVWGFQFERWRPTPYIGATTGSTVTRNADVLTFPVSEEWYGSPTGVTMYFETVFDHTQGATAAEYRRYLATLFTGSSDLLDIFVSGNNLSVSGENANDGASLSQIGTLVVPTSTPVRIALTYNNGVIIAAMNGQSGTWTRTITPSAMTTLVVGANLSSARNLNQRLSRFWFAPFAVSQAELEAITR